MAPVTTSAGLFHSVGAGTQLCPAATACRRVSQLRGSASGRSSSERTRLTGSGATLRSSGLSVRFPAARRELDHGAFGQVDMGA